MSTQICPACNCQRQLPGSGGIWENCHACDGKGYIYFTETNHNEEKEDISSLPIDSLKENKVKARGRPKKV